MARSFNRTDLTLSGGTVSLKEEELAWLLRGLAAQDSPDARSLGEEIGALHSAGVRIQLHPSSGECEALRSVLRSGRTSGRMPSPLARLLTLCGD